MLSHYTVKDLIIIDPQVKDKDDLFEKMVNHLYNLDYIFNKKGFLKALKEREKVANTELMAGVALPHSRSDSVEKLFLSIVIVREGIDFGNPDMGKAKIIFFFGTADKFNKEYLQLLAKSARLLKIEEFRERLLSCTDSDQVMMLLDEYDKPEEEIIEGDKQYMMLITLHNEQKLEDLLSSLIELGITNATIMESMSLKSRVSLDIPLFSGIDYVKDKKHKESIVVMCLTTDINHPERLAGLLKENDIDLECKGTGFIQIIESALLIGNPEEEVEL